MKILIAYLAKPRYGGWVTFTAHLHRGLRDAGYEPILVKVGNRTEKQLRNFGRKIHYRNLSATDLLSVSKGIPTIIAAMDKHHHDVANQMLKAGVPIVIHDPTELKPEVVAQVKNANVVVIRDFMMKHLPHATMIHHPYAPKRPARSTDRKPAVALSRIDFDKHTELIVQANQKLVTPIDVYGFCNSMYAHFKLEEVDPDWKRNYHGTFDADDLYAATRLATGYERVVDMSAIKGDGGGTQYTFLEAIDAGASLILNRDWNPQGLLRDYAHTAGTADELAELCERPMPDRSAIGNEILKVHDARNIARSFYEVVTR